MWLLALTTTLAACSLNPSRKAGLPPPVKNPVFDQSLATIGGLTVDERDHPLSNVAIRIARAGEKATSLQSDSDGAFFLDAVPGANAYELSFSLAGRGHLRRLSWIDPGSSYLGQIKLLPEIPVLGKLIDASSKPIMDVDVVARDPHGREVGRATTGAEGRFAIGGLAAGHYKLSAADGDLVASERSIHTPAPAVSLRAHRLFALQGVIKKADSMTAVVEFLGGNRSRPIHRISVPDSTFSLSVPRGTYELFAFNEQAPFQCAIVVGVEVPAKKASQLEVKLEPCHQLRGVVKKEGGGAIAGAAVSVMPDAPSALRRAQRTDPLGRFVVGPLPAGKHRLEIWAEGLLPDIGRVISLPRKDAVEVTLTRGRQLHGTVTNPQQQPVAGAIVRAVLRSDPGRQPIFAGVGELGILPGPIPPIPRDEPSTTGDDQPNHAMTIWSTVTGADGTFRLSGLPPATVRLHADHRTAGNGQSAWLDIRKQATASINVQLTPPLSIEGVVRSPNGSPIVGAKVVATPVGSKASSTTTDYQGHFRLAATPSSKVAFKVSSRGYLPLSRVADTTRKAKLAFVLQPTSGQLNGMVLDEHGMPLGGVRVSMTAQGGKAWTRSDSLGRFTLPGVSGSRNLVVVAEHAGYASTSHRPRRGEYLYLRLARLKVIKGRVQSKRIGTPVARFTVTVAGAYDRKSFRRGIFTLSLPPGKHQLTVQADHFATHTVDLAVSRDAQLPQQVTVSLTAAGTVTGVALDAHGSPVSGVALQVGGVRGRTDKSGRFAISGVPEGTHTLTADAAGRRTEAGGVVVRQGETTGPLQLTFH